MKKALFVLFIVFLIFIIPVIHFLDKTYFLCPIVYKKYIIIRRDNRGLGDFDAPRRGGRRHQGIDLYAKIGAEVKSPRFGRVIEAGFHKALGNYVELHHSENLITVYGHLSQVLVKPYQIIPQGKIIGLVGKTGNADHPGILPHLHFEVRKNNIPINPMDWLE